MVRPQKGRKIGCIPDCRYFKPAGVPVSTLTITEINLDELEAMRLVDADELSQTAAAKKMGISQSTVARLVQSGRQKAAQALVSGNALKLKDGTAPLIYTKRAKAQKKK